MAKQIKIKLKIILDESQKSNPEITFLSDEDLIKSVDEAFKVFDEDDDGIISYSEYNRHHLEQAERAAKAAQEPAPAT